MLKASHFIHKLNLKPHIEGGYYREVYRNHLEIAKDIQQTNSQNLRNLSTSIYFLLEAAQVSKFHSLMSDELWYYHYGAAMLLHCINTDGSYECKKLGPNILSGEEPYMKISAGTIFGAEPNCMKSFSFVSCVVSPGFDFRDFKMYTSEELVAIFPQHKNIILRLAT